MYGIAAFLVAASTLAFAAPTPQAPSTSCNASLPTIPFQLAAIPVFANYSMIALTTTGGGSGIEIIPTNDGTFTDAANFTYDTSTLRLTTNGAPVSDTSYTSVTLVDNDALSFSTTVEEGSGNIGVISNISCDGLPYFINADESSVGLYGWTLCNQGALGWVGTSTAEPCEKVALKAFVNTTVTPS